MTADEVFIAVTRKTKKHAALDPVAKAEHAAFALNRCANQLQRSAARRAVIERCCDDSDGVLVHRATGLRIVWDHHEELWTVGLRD
jgi:hypothetical protein